MSESRNRDNTFLQHEIYYLFVTKTKIVCFALPTVKLLITYQLSIPGDLSN